MNHARLDHLPEVGFQGLQGAGFVLAHQPRIAGDVGDQDGRKPPSDGGSLAGPTAAFPDRKAFIMRHPSTHAGCAPPAWSRRHLGRTIIAMESWDSMAVTGPSSVARRRSASPLPL